MLKTRKIALTPERWEEVCSLFDQCIVLQGKARDEFLAESTKGRDWLREEVISLLARSHVPDDFLGRPLVQRIAEQGSATETITVLPATSPTLGKYFLVHQLGRGGMAEVFLAKEFGPSRFTRLVALKRLLTDYTSDPDFRKRFEFEAKLSSRLSHSNIVHTYGFEECGGHYLLTMELVNGKSLLDLCRRVKELDRQIPLELALTIVAGVAEGLAYAHDRRDDATGRPLGIVHRDISPKNIMISFEGDVKIVDFGIAKARDQLLLTRSGLLVGTAGYFSPEAVSGLPVDGRSDVFSLGVVLYELLASRPLFVKRELLSTIRQIKNAGLISTTVDTLDADPELRELLHLALAPIPQDRLSSIEFQRRLAAFLPGNSTSGAKGDLALFVRSLFAAERAELRQIMARAEKVTFPSVVAPTAALSSARGSWLARAVMVLAIGTILAFAIARFIDPAGPEMVSPDSVRPGVVRGDAVTPKITPLDSPGSGIAPLEFAKPGITPPAHSLPPTAQDPMSTGPCADEAARLCPGKRIGGGLVACLEAQSLSPECRRALDARPPK